MELMRKYLLTIVLLALCVAFIFIVFNLNNPGGEPPITKVIKDIAFLDTGIRNYKLDNGKYPTTTQGLEALIVKPTIGDVPSHWRNDYLPDENLLIDPWGNKYLYFFPGRQKDFDIISYGKDGKVGGTGKNKDFTN